MALEPNVARTDCPLLSIDEDVMHGEPLFDGARLPVEGAIESYYAYREPQGLSDEEAVAAPPNPSRRSPGADGLRAVLAYEAEGRGFAF